MDILGATICAAPELLDVGFMNYKPSSKTDVRNRCAIILAAGEGVRLRSFVQRLRGDTLPKQYVKFFGGMSMLQATFKRAERLIPPERTFTVVDQSHFEFAEVTQQLVAQPKMHCVVQSRNRDTAIGLLLPLAHLLKRHPDATVAVFPSDHFISDDDLFVAHVDAAFSIVEQDAAKIILLGITPRSAEPDYGYIVPDDDAGGAFPRGARVVSRFVEKPSHALAQEIVSRGGFWNTLIMIFTGRNFLNYVRVIDDQLFGCFWRIHDALGTGKEISAIKSVYEAVQPTNFSKGVLEELPQRCSSQVLVLPVRGVYWCDCGSEERVGKFLGHVSEPASSKSTLPQASLLSRNQKLARTA
jgi:mannose-1-phosphate guanylyltransferase